MSSFFQNKGAVTGVFVFVGIAGTAVVFSILFWFRRRRKNRRLDHDTEVAATLAEHGYGRQNLIGADDDHPVGDPRTISSAGSGSSSDMRRISTPSMTLSGLNPGPASGGYGRQSYPPFLDDTFGQTYNPYTNNQNTHSGPSNASGTSGLVLPSVHSGGRSFFAHGPNESMGSSEPLLWGNSGHDTPPETTTPVIPPRNPLRLAGRGQDDNSDQAGGRTLYNGKGGYEDDDDEYEALRKRSLKVCPGVVDPMYTPPIAYDQF